MAVNLEKNLDYDVLLETLLDKTKAGKLVWHETADEYTFIAALKGERTFEITSKTSLTSQLSAPGTRVTSKALSEPTILSLDEVGDNAAPIVRVRDGQGRLLFETPPSALTAELYDLARRIAMHVDEEINSTMEILEQL